jgi:hypothetical protein
MAPPQTVKHENIYMAQPEGFVVEGEEYIYGLKQAFRQWYL